MTARPEFDYEVFFAEAAHVGYKRTTRHPDGISQPNDLFGVDADSNVVIDTENPKTILDSLRSKRFFFWNVDELKTLNRIELFNHLRDTWGRSICYHQYLSRAAKSGTLRISARFQHPKFAYLGECLSHLTPRKLKDYCLYPVVSGVPPVYDEEGEGCYLSLREIRYGDVNLNEAKHVADEFLAECSPRFVAQKNDLLIALSGEGSIGKVGLYRDNVLSVFSNFIGRIRLKDENSPLVFLYLLKLPLVQLQIEREKAGMGNLTNLYPNQIGTLAVPYLTYEVQQQIASAAATIESKIEIERAKIRRPQDIINQILCHEFGYPLKKHQEREYGRKLTYSRNLSQMSAGFTLRNSAKFHHPDFELTDRFFAATPYERVKNYVSVPIRLGATAVKGDFVEEGDAYYVHPGATKKQEVINVEDCHQVMQEFYDKTKRRFGLLPGDVVINRSSEALGKIALFNLDEPAVASDFTMRVRFNNAMNPYFAWYFMRSVMFQAQISREQRGAGLPNIFPGQIERLLIVECPRDRQDAIADAITAELRKRANSLRAIEAKRKEIDELIEAAILKSHA